MCYEPITIVNQKTNMYQSVSCRKCIECEQTRANEWALRGHFELLEHNQNTFITLTYEKDPIILIKKDLQNFIKRLRKHIEPIKIKYFSAGEYGDQNLRPHFHMIIFGYDFQDKEYIKMSPSGKPIYESQTLKKIWQHGHCIIQDANVNTIRYTAKYSSKTKEDLPKHLKKYPEFNTMSQNLGIKGILKNMETYMLTDEIYIDGFSYQIPLIVLEKYAKHKFTLSEYYDRENFITDYINTRKFRYRNTEERSEAKRRAEKKRLLTKKRYL